MAPRAPPAASTRRNRVKEISAEEVKQHKTEEDLWVIIGGQVYDCTRWQERHPGGNLVLLGTAGEDASVPFVSFHDVKKAAPIMKGCQIGVVKDYQSSNISQDFETLRQQLVDDKIFVTDYNYYYGQCAWFVVLFSFVVYLLTSERTSLILLGGVALGFFWQQIAFVGHDIGHNSITHVRELDWWWGSFVTLFFGVSGQWWKRSHNTHHIFPNSLDWDPDIQHLPFLAIDSKLFKGIFSFYHGHRFEFDFISSLFVRVQHILFFPIMGLARNFMYVQSWILALNPYIPMYGRKEEIAALAGYWVWYIYLLSFIPTTKLRVAVYFISHGFCGILHHQITLSHFAMPAYTGTGYDTAEANDHYIKVQLATTTDVGCPWWLDWFHGGLQFQTAHHLFPRVPRHNLRKLREEYLLPFCKKHGLKYSISAGFLSTTMVVIRKLHEQAAAVSAGKHIAFKDTHLAELLHSTIES